MPSPNVEKSVLTALIGRQCMGEGELKALVEKCQAVDIRVCGGGEASDFKSVIQNVSYSLEDYEMELQRVRDQLTGEFMFVLINKTNNEWTQKATPYKADEIDVLKGIISAIFAESNNRPHDRFWVPFHSIKQLPDLDEVQGKFDSKSFDQVILTFVADGWLAMKSEKIYLPTRTLAELKPYLTDLYGPTGSQTLQTCAGCHQIFTCGRQCSSENCVRVHEYCVNAYFQKYSNGSTKCAKCGSDMNESYSVISV